LSNSTEDEIAGHEDGLKQLAVFFGAVASDPQRFPVTGRMASKITEAQRQAKQPAQKPKRLNARKLRQAARQGGAKRRRAERKENVENFNQAQQAYVAELVEMQQIHQENEARAQALIEQETLTPAEFVEALTLIGAPEAIQHAASRVQSAPEAPTLLLPAGVESSDHADLIPAHVRWPGGAPT
jgi:hypothetical protein